jgi:hypothetical protein
MRSATPALCSARSQHVEEVGQEVDGEDVRVEFPGENQCRRTRAAADVGNLQVPPLRQPRQFDGATRFRLASRSLAVRRDVKVNQKLEVFHRVIRLRCEFDAAPGPAHRRDPACTAARDDTQYA